MIRINQIKVSAFADKSELDAALLNKVSKKLNISKDRINSVAIFKRSLDARKKNDINYVYTIDADIKDEKSLRIKDKDVSIIDSFKYKFPFLNKGDNSRPIIVGLGPAGLFCAYMLAKAGFNPIIFERGKKVEERTRDVEEFWKNGKLNVSSNVQFGEGGAGTFSDGKLNTLVKDRFGRNRAVLEILVTFGAPPNILYDNKPHIGTDVLATVVTNMRNEIIKCGATIYYESCVTDLIVNDGNISGVIVKGKAFYSDRVILAVGHSARDTFEMLYKHDINMDQKAFAIGMRVMHPQNMIDVNQYGEANVSRGLPVADYKLTYTASNGRGVYSFCMCPGGYVVNASSEEGLLAVNGMSYHARDSKDANSAIVVQVTPDDFGSEHVLAGVEFQRDLERKAFEAGNGKIPVERYGAFRHAINDSLLETGELEVVPQIRGQYSYGDISKILPRACNEAFVEGMEHFGTVIKGFNDGNALVAAIESRTSSPVRINRNEDGVGSVSGFYPCGEGAGYAGGITSAAMDGIFIAECVAKSYINS